MTRDRPLGESFAIGAWRVDPHEGVIRGEEREVRLEPQLMSLLLLFAASPGRVIAKDEIVARVWDGRSIGDDTLSGAISRLRSALGETKERRYIETLPKRGYRFLLAPDAQAARPSTRSDEVDELIAKGRAATRMPLPPALVQARLYFERAIARDPKRAAAHAGLANVMLLQLMTGQDAPSVLIPAAKSAAQAAVALDEASASAWTSLGLATLLADRDFDAADAALLRAVALHPDSEHAHAARAFALSAIGRFVEAERAARRAVEIDPVSLTARRNLLQTLLLARRYADTIAEAKRALALSGDSFEVWSAKGWAHAMLGQDDEAVASLLEHLKLLGADERTLARGRADFARGGFAEFCRGGADLFEKQRVFFVPRPMDIAMLRAFGGEADKAFAALELVLKHNDPVLVFLPYLPWFDRIRNDPRFADFAARARPVRATR
jgi:DNA-binding winged helix-turn-helix (wHTH) protein/Tfp pilus assembly protein PilF